MLGSLILSLVVAAISSPRSPCSARPSILHRTATHRALELHPAVAWMFRFSLWLTTGLSTKEWVAVHRKHHAFTDEEGDPHSPMLDGLLVRPARQRLSLHQGSEEQRRRRALRARHQGRLVGPDVLPSRPARPGRSARRAVRRARHRLGTAGRGHSRRRCTCSCSRRRSTACATRSATRTSTTPRPTSACSRCSPAARGCTTTTTDIRAARSSAVRASEIDPAWPIIKLLIVLQLAKPYKTIEEALSRVDATLDARTHERTF